MNQSVITPQKIEEFLKKLQEDGKCSNVIAEYSRNLTRLYQIAAKHDVELDKEISTDWKSNQSDQLHKEIAENHAYVLNEAVLKEWKTDQLQQEIAPGTVTNRTVKINQFLRFAGLEELCFQNGRRQNLAGMQFGSLIAIEPTERKSADRSIYWKCRCTACGKEKEIPANQLKKGVQISCGCQRAHRLQQTNGYVDGTCLKKVLSNKVNCNNTSGYKGVFLKRGKWTAQIQYKKKVYYLGSFDSLKDAVDARKQAEDWVRMDAEKLLEKVQEAR